MTPETHAALGRVTAFLDAWEDHSAQLGAISTLRSEGLRLTAADLRVLLAAAEPPPVIEWGVRYAQPTGPGDVPFPSRDAALAALRAVELHTPGFAECARLIHRTRPRDIEAPWWARGPWTEDEPTGSAQ